MDLYFVKKYLEYEISGIALVLEGFSKVPGGLFRQLEIRGEGDFLKISGLVSLHSGKHLLNTLMTLSTSTVQMLTYLIFFNNWQLSSMKLKLQKSRKDATCNYLSRKLKGNTSKCQNSFFFTRTEFDSHFDMIVDESRFRKKRRPVDRAQGLGLPASVRHHDRRLGYRLGRILRRVGAIWFQIYIL